MHSGLANWPPVPSASTTTGGEPVVFGGERIHGLRQTSTDEPVLGASGLTRQQDQHGQGWTRIGEIGRG